ncbi:MAG: hypothetical protein M3209_15215, partial [Acidobacteriota bacterium]|nr:hypothetical protein [Acidobacteriota bacterium]
MKNLVWTILILAAFALACGGSDSGGESGGGGIFSFGDETGEANQLAIKANENLSKIGKIHKANARKLDDLQSAMRERDTVRTQQILEEIIKAIEEGLSLGEVAYTRVNEAAGKKTDEIFSEYLRLKKEALRKQIDAYEFRLKVAKDLRDKFGSNKPEEIERAKADFAVNQENFQKLWDAAEDL